MTDPTRALALTLVDELARAGLAEASLAPGSRSAPLALALAEHPDVVVHVHVDERSAAFFALGAAKASGRPALALCTSGTAAANFHPAAVEADLAGVPLLLVTADRPPALRATGANQTIDQLELFGGAVRWFCEVGLAGAAAGEGRYWRSLASRAWAAALGPPAGPVHLNVAFDEPLVPAPGGGEPAPGRPGGAPWTAAGAPRQAPAPADVATLAELVRSHPRGLLVAGWGGPPPEALTRLAEASGWPLLADPLSDARTGPLAVSTYDLLLRVPEFAERHRPGLVLRTGAGPTSKPLAGWLDGGVPQVLVDPDGAWRDPGRAASLRLAADPAALLEAVAGALGEPGAERRAWPAAWMAAEAAARHALDELLDGWDEPFEGRVARDLVAALPGGATLVVGSSMPVRDVDAFAAPRRGLRFLANRGASGIDGFVSTTLGVAATAGGPVAALCGDLAVLHDASSLLGAAPRRPGAVLVVCDNDGGGIFSFLPQARLPTDRFEQLFGTPHGLDLGALAAAARLPWQRLKRAADLEPALTAALAAGDTHLLLVPSDRATNVTRHRAAQDAVAAAVRAILD